MDKLLLLLILGCGAADEQLTRFRVHKQFRDKYLFRLTGHRQTPSVHLGYNVAPYNSQVLVSHGSCICM